MRLRFTRRAASDLTEIADYIRMHNPSAAQRVRAAIFDSLQSLTEFPYIGRAQAGEGIRKFVARKYPYLIYYTVDAAAEEVVIIAIQHPSRDREFNDA